MQRGRTLLLALALACSPGAFAASAEDLFNEGRGAFERNDYAHALNAFQAAAEAGLAGPAVHFNVGVAAYRLGRYDEAEKAFRTTAQTAEMAALAHYNLGLVALRRANDRAAAEWFGRARDGADDERLRRLAEAQLDALNARAPPTRKLDWVAYGLIGGGYDDNVALVSDVDVLGVSGIDDTFTEAQVALGLPAGSPWRLDAGAMLLDYHELNAFDQLNTYGGARYRWDVNAWSHEAQASLSYAALDGERFETARTLGAQTSFRPQADWRGRLRYRYSDVDGAGAFVGLSGHRHEGRLELQRPWLGWQLTGDYTYEASDLEDDALAARSHELGFEASRALTEWRAVGEARLRSARYDSGDDEEQWELTVTLSRQLGARWRIVAQYAYTDNDSSLDDFDYTRHRFRAALEAQL